MACYLGYRGAFAMQETIVVNAVNADIDNKTAVLARYGMQLAMLNRLLTLRLISDREHHRILESLKRDYKIA